MNSFEKNDLTKLKSECEFLILLINECIETDEIHPINQKLINNTRFYINEYSI